MQPSAATPQASDRIWCKVLKPVLTAFAFGCCSRTWKVALSSRRRNAHEFGFVQNTAESLLAAVSTDFQSPQQEKPPARLRRR